MMLHAKNYWINFDPNGTRLNIPFDYFGEDYPSELIDEEEEEDVEDDTPEEDDVGDADWATEDDFWL